MKPILTKTDLFTTSLCHKDQMMVSCSLILVLSVVVGSLRMPATVKKRLVVTFSFAFSNDAAHPDLKRSVS